MQRFQDILSEYQDIYKNPDLFGFWECEFALRRLARETDLNAALLIKEVSELDFLMRSLYFAGRPHDFFIILINNLHIHPVLQWLQKAPGWLQKAFLSFLPWYISQQNDDAQKLQFLVSIYQDSYQDAYQAIANVLNLDLCSYLLSRTANPQLRTLLRNREEQLLKEKSEAVYGIRLEAVRNPIFATLYGDKFELLGDTFELMHLTDSRNFQDPYCAERFQLLLRAGEMLFDCGLLEDCLINLEDTYEAYQKNNRLVESLEDVKIYRQFFKILRRVIPCYALLYKPNSAWTRAIEIYNQFFSRLEADLPSLQYLNVYESIAAGQQLDAQHIGLEIIYKSIKIQDFRSGEPPLLCVEDIDSGFSQERLRQLQQLFREKLSILPHEAFTIMELLRLLQLRGYLELDNKLAKALLTAYMQLWKWVPSRLFINRSIIEQLSSKLDDSSRLDAERLLSSLDNYSDETMSNDLLTRPELFRKRSENIRREIFIGKFLGLL
ncbi:MAG: hypothetical protein PHX14_01805 [Syntrophomonadaceae bacterium]|nr:hypothetical protein [Syntrophomonadaceae bacterium]